MNNQRVTEISEQSKREKWPFPTTFDMLKAAGIESCRFDVSTGGTLFIGADGTSFMESMPGAPRLGIAPAFKAAEVAAALRRHQKARTGFLEFRGEAALAGVRFWNVDMKARTRTFVGMDGGVFVENIPLSAS
jgi:uncharacterized protein YbcV (DUF1398 family)